VGLLLALVLLPFAMPWIPSLQLEPGTLVVAFHLTFNLMLALTFIGFTGRVATLTERWLPDARSPEGAGQPRYLDPARPGDAAAGARQRGTRGNPSRRYRPGHAHGLIDRAAHQRHAARRSAATA